MNNKEDNNIDLTINPSHTQSLTNKQKKKNEQIAEWTNALTSEHTISSGTFGRRGVSIINLKQHNRLKNRINVKHEDREFKKSQTSSSFNEKRYSDRKR